MFFIKYSRNSFPRNISFMFKISKKNSDFLGGAPARGGGGGDSGCRKCGEEGHMSRDCTQPDVCK